MLGALLLFYVVFVSGVLYVFLFGQTEFHRDGFIGRLHRALTSCPQRCCSMICGERCYNNAENWCCNKRNPVLQLVYVCIMTVGTFLFLHYVYYEFPNMYLPSYHSYTSLISIIISYATFIIACASDPGVVTPENERMHQKIFGYDYLLYIPKDCPATNVTRPARSKTCRICNQCVAKFDHHCAWINNDVGLNNYRYFLAFLLANSLMCFYGTYICAMVLLNIITKNRLMESIFVTASGQRVQANLAIVLQYLLHYHVVIIALGFFMLAVGITLFGFWGYHAVLTMLNITTNESFKWKDIKWQVNELKAQKKEAEKAKKKKNKLVLHDEKQEGEEEDDDLVLVDGDGKPVGPDQQKQYENTVAIAEGRAPMDNPYNKGLFANIWEVLYPPSSRPEFQRLISKEKPRTSKFITSNSNNSSKNKENADAAKANESKSSSNNNNGVGLSATKKQTAVATNNGGSKKNGKKKTN
eukprot:GEZU01036337.1.p1 GENE.GEZU01036337.1~~GEZU01036337.1.p1  ORF type:complete len:478 (+),score=123.00 GEZU01036337.1:25-1434(+)